MTQHEREDRKADVSSEALDEVDLPTLGDDLQALLAPSGNLEGRTAKGLDRRLRSGSFGSLALDLLGTGWFTACVILTEADCGADGERGEQDG